ncbi:hypothetical protein BJ912DRAFT_967790 [Pholiota molesta]|nr:hypothetical protein BJ912DRAFT_967790 [Pholiota molesta]
MRMVICFGVVRGPCRLCFVFRGSGGSLMPLFLLPSAARYPVSSAARIFGACPLANLQRLSRHVLIILAPPVSLDISPSPKPTSERVGVTPRSPGRVDGEGGAWVASWGGVRRRGGVRCWPSTPARNRLAVCERRVRVLFWRRSPFVSGPHVGLNSGAFVNG